ncbi:MAG TPA: DUF6443 domain-containing protein [Ohtaekwangia sp.]|uniref:DUF6443 domain-containing protein n=1 Tax=Ohtaekwangia sp. TaxID=2066019 RepID=UPI002F92FD65
MVRYITLFSLFISAGLSFGQPSNNYNYVKEEAIQVKNVVTPSQATSLTIGDKVETTTYVDGLGRTTQIVTSQGSPAKMDVVQPQTYDAFGREAIHYLPYISTEQNGWFKANALGTTDYSISPQFLFYSNPSTDKTPLDLKPYAETRFETSPLIRPIVVGSIGATWQPDGTDNYTSTDHTTKKLYTLNDANEVLLWKYDAVNGVSVTDINTPGMLIYYPEGQLNKVKTKDEQGNEVIEYTDNTGRLILKRVQVVDNTTVVNDINYASTYYIYDDFGNLVTVIPPEGVRAVKNTIAN